MSKVFQQMLIAGLAALAVACSSGSASSASSQPTPSASVKVAGLVSGTTGALSFNRQPMLTGSATVTVNSQPGTTAQIQPGTVIQGTATRTSQGIQLVSVNLHHDLEGVISSIDLTGSRFVVLGKTVLVDALTRIVQEGPRDAQTSLTLADLKTGDYVEVYGSEKADGTVLATRVERETAGAIDADTFHGTVSALDTTAKTFQAGGFLVSYGSATVSGTLANGVRVEVRGTASGLSFAAVWVKIEVPESDAEVELSGPISGLDTTAKTFLLMSYKVDYSAAEVEGTLVEGAQVEVEGAAGPAGTTTLMAREVTVRFSSGGSGTSDTEKVGTVTAVDAVARTISLGSVTFWTDGATLFVKGEAPATFSAVTVGAMAEIHALSTKTNTAGQAYASLVVVGGS
ncbi:MAG TPA: DUF5666 domain-containing protein [Geothrix sp.]|jgi:hypothetical protein